MSDPNLPSKPQQPPEAGIPGSQQGATGDGKPEHQISGPDGVTPTPDSQAAGGAAQPKPPEKPPEAPEGPAQPVSEPKPEPKPDPQPQPEAPKPPQGAVPPDCKPPSLLSESGEGDDEEDDEE